MKGDSIDRNKLGEDLLKSKSNLECDWKELINLVCLSLDSNQITSTLPPDWKALINLQELWLNKNQITPVRTPRP